jgi:hypothetical protein
MGRTLVSGSSSRLFKIVVVVVVLCVPFLTYLPLSVLFFGETEVVGVGSH